MKDKEQRKRETMEALSNERMYILLKHNREIMLELKSLYPNEDELFESYKTLGKAFDEAIMAEIRHRNKIIEPQLVSITDLAEKITEKLVDISEGLSEAINGAIERNRKEIEDVHNV